MKSKHILVALGVIAPITASAWSLPGLKTTDEGVMYRVVSSEEASGFKAPEYRLIERERDDEDLAARPVNVTLREALPLRHAVTQVLANEHLAVRFTGPRAMEAANQMTGPAVLSGNIKGALAGFARAFGLQVSIRADYVEFSERRAYELRPPTFENTTEIAARLQRTRAAAVKVAGGAIYFDADQDGLADVKSVIRDIKAGRRGTGAFLASQAAAAQPGLTPVSAPPMAPLGPPAAAPAVKPVVPGAATTAGPSAPIDPLARPITLEFEGDLVDAVRRLATHAGINMKVVKPLTRPVQVALRLRQEPLSLALQRLDAQAKGSVDLIYVRNARRIDVVAR